MALAQTKISRGAGTNWLGVRRAHVHTYHIIIIINVKANRVGSPEATASLLLSPQGGEWIIAVVNQEPLWGCMGRKQNSNLGYTTLDHGPCLLVSTQN